MNRYRKVVPITTEFYSVIKKKEMIIIFRKMTLEIIIPSKINQTKIQICILFLEC